MTRARDVANLIGSGNYSSTTFTATAGQTAFTISHTQGFVQVFMNGLLLDETVDYTSNGSAVTLTSGAAAGDEIEVVKYNTFSVGDALNQAAADTRYVNTAGDTMTGNLTVGGLVSATGTSTATNTEADIGLYHTFKNLSSNVNTGVAITMGSNNSGSATIYAQRTGANNEHKMGFQTRNSSGSALTRMAIDGSGRVTMPYQPAFGARNTTDATVWKGGSVYVNTGNHWNNTTGTFTAPVAGNYYFFGGGQSANSGAFYWGFYKNGGQIYEFYNSISGYTYGHASVAAVVPMVANDTLQFKKAGSVNMNTGGQNHFSGFLIG